MAHNPSTIIRACVGSLLAALLLTAGFGLLLVSTSGCGFIADKDLIKIAKIGDHFITRGELAKVIHDMPDDERPSNIRNKGDLLRALNDYIDELIRIPIAESMAEQLEKMVPREAAMQRYFKEHPDDNYASLYATEDAESAGMSPEALKAQKAQIDEGIDRTLTKMRGEAAVALKAMESIKKGTLTISDEEYQQEYGFRKNDLKKLEWMRFRAIRFRAETANSEAEAAAVRKRLDAGEPFDKLFEEYASKDKELILTSEIENNPGLAKFQQFWLNASGSKKGDIIGPVFLPEYQIMSNPDAQGKARVQNMPAAYLVIEVLDQRPETTLTLEEAKPRLAPFVLLAKMMAQLRQENGVEIYEDKLPDPSIYTDRTDEPFGARK